MLIMDEHSHQTARLGDAVGHITHVAGELELPQHRPKDGWQFA